MNNSVSNTVITEFSKCNENSVITVFETLLFITDLNNLSNYNSEHFDVWCRSMANSYQINK
jgi:hypothetical protein